MGPNNIPLLANARTVIPCTGQCSRMTQSHSWFTYLSSAMMMNTFAAAATIFSCVWHPLSQLVTERERERERVREREREPLVTICSTVKQHVVRIEHSLNEALG